MDDEGIDGEDFVRREAIRAYEWVLRKSGEPPEKHETAFCAVREEPDGFLSRVVLASDGITTDAHTRGSRGCVQILWPPGVDDSTADAANGKYKPMVLASTTIEDLLRRVATTFVHGLEIGVRMSDELEVGLSVRTPDGGYTALHLRAPAGWVNSAADAAIRAALRPPPTLPPFPQHPAERLVFSPPPGVAA
jgi:hypothetical protein